MIPLRKAGWYRFFRELKRRMAALFKKIFRPRCVSDHPDRPGVLMIQIDGLSYRQLRKAFSKNRLPYLQSLSENKGYKLNRFYSGMPSTTAAFQGELFYGVKSGVPAVAFYDRQQEKKQVLLFPSSADSIARQLESSGKPLLKGGTSYSNIYTGGAGAARYCIQTMRLRSMRHLASSVKLFIVLLLQPLKFFRMAGYGIMETGIALYDFFRGVVNGRDFFKEFKFVPTRIVLCILLRELIRTRVKMDVSRGVRIVHASFLGYDEQSHRRGPDSAFAHWTLKGIDGVIGDIHRVAKKSACRKYQLVIYSDHGQEKVVPFERRFGKSLQQAVKDALVKVNDRKIHSKAACIEPETLRHRRRSREVFFKQDRKKESWIGPDLDGIIITALGPIGHVYLPEPFVSKDRCKLAELLVSEARIPLVLFMSENRVAAVNKKGRFDLETDFPEVLGDAHPLAERTARDLAGVCRHPDAGDLVISGWFPGEPPVTFAFENGGHGGPGAQETSGFVMTPDIMNLPDGVSRPLDLRRRVDDLLEKQEI